MIHLDSEIAGSSFDPKTLLTTYTLEKAGRRWTVQIHLNAFDGMNKEQRRAHLTAALEQATYGLDDEQKRAAEAASAKSPSPPDIPA